ncbi:MAG: response regulator, partial [Acidobacteria bacterium]
MALEGTLRDFSFADILQLISLQRKTGVLTLKDAENVVTISFLDGSIIGSSSLSQHPEDRIGLILLKRGEITENELETALKRQEETLQRLGRILIDYKLVDGEAVRVALSKQILQIVYRVFRWGDGDYHFSQETDIDYDRDLMRPMAADSIIMEGAR